MTRTLTELDSSTAQQADSEEAGFGTLSTSRGRLPLVAMEVRTRITDLTAMTTVRQTYRNALDEHLEATYIFPLPDRAAVTQFRMQVGDRTIEGDLKERGEAREVYDQAIAQGHRTSIAEEDRPGVFNLRVGNLPPGEEATVELTLCGPLPVADGEATFRFPLVVAPRYTPGVPLDGPSVGAGITPDTDEVPDASRVTPPVLLPGFANPVQLSLEVQLDPPSQLSDLNDWSSRVRSSLHSTISEGGSPFTVRLQPGERLNRDFILRFPVAGSSIATSLRISPAAGKQPGTFALTLFPPAADPTTSPLPRDVVFVLDRSGSMGGWKMVAARRALGRMVDTLLDQDRFTVLAFDHQIELPPQVRPGELLPAGNRERWRMLEWLGGLEARGGTEMRPALEQAFQSLANTTEPDRLPNSPRRRRVVVLVTDGQVTGEDAILQALGSGAIADRPSIFTVGIDQAVNAGFLRRLADFGSGACELVESEDRLDAALDRIHRLIGTPVLTDVRLEPLDFDWVQASLAPERLGDLFADRPVTVLGRHLVDRTEVRLRMHATDAGGSPWTTEVTGRLAGNELLATWGRAKVRDLEDRYAAGHDRNPQKLSEQIVQVSLESCVLSRFTAYVAVDRSEVVNQGGRQQQLVQPVEQPAGWAPPTDALRCMFASASMEEVGSQKLRKLKRAVPPRMAAPDSLDEKHRLRGGPPESGMLDDAADSIPPCFDTGDDFDVADSLLCRPSEEEAAFSSAPGDAAGLVDESSPPVVKLCRMILTEAYRRQARELLIEPQENDVRVQLTIEGKSVELAPMPRHLIAAVVKRLKLLAGMDSAMSHQPRQGTARVTIDAHDLELQIQIEPSQHGDRVRILLPESPPSPETALAENSAPRKKRFWT